MKDRFKGFGDFLMRLMRELTRVPKSRKRECGLDIVNFFLTFGLSLEDIFVDFGYCER